MNTNSNGAKNQQVLRRSFLKVFGAAAGAVMAAAVVPAPAGEKVSAASMGDLSARQRLLLSCFNNMNDVAQQFMLDMAEHNVRSLPRQPVGLSAIAGGAA